MLNNYTTVLGATVFYRWWYGGITAAGAVSITEYLKYRNYWRWWWNF
jgi:hypothetical protein